MIFPALIPSSRVFTPGEYPATAFMAYSGVENRVRHSDVFLAARLELTFLGLTETQMLSILSHYEDLLGAFNAFEVPEELFSFSTITDYIPGVYRWIYAEPPAIEDLPCGNHNVAVTLESVPPQSVILTGVNFTIFLFLSAGVATGDVAPPQFTATVQITLSAGLAFSSSLNPQFSNVSLLLPMDGADGSTDFPDFSIFNHTVTPNSLTVVSTAQSKFGGASMFVDGIGYLIVPGSEAFIFPGDFSVQAWVRPSVLTGFATRTMTVIGSFIDNITINIDAISRFQSSVSVNDVPIGGRLDAFFTAGQWSYISLTRKINTVEIAIDGVVRGTGIVTGTVNPSGDAVRVGTGISSGQFIGYIDDFRITKGVALTHAVPTAPFPDS